MPENETTRPADAGPLERQVRPQAWYSAKVDDCITDAKKAARQRTMPWEAEHYDQALYGQVALREAGKVLEDMHANNAALRADVLAMREVLLRCVSGIDHLSELARLWEPDYSSGSDRRGWVLARDARDDAEKALAEHAARVLGPNAELTGLGRNGGTSEG